MPFGGVEKVTIDSKEMLLDFKLHGYTQKAIAGMLRVKPSTVSYWLKNNEMPKRMYDEIQKILEKDFPTPMNCGCNIHGDIFLYRGQKVWIDLYKYWEDGWNACAKEVEKVLTTEEYLNRNQTNL